MSKQSRTPDYNVKVLDKATNEKGRIGAGWINEDGSISIVLNTFVVITSSPNLVITLFSNDGKEV